MVQTELEFWLNTYGSENKKNISQTIKDETSEYCFTALLLLMLNITVLLSKIKQLMPVSIVKFCVATSSTPVRHSFFFFLFKFDYFYW